MDCGTCAKPEAECACPALPDPRRALPAGGGMVPGFPPPFGDLAPEDPPAGE